MANKKPNILVLWGDDIGITNVSAYSDGLMGTAPRTSIASPMRARGSPTTTASNHAPRGGQRSSADRTLSYRAHQGRDAGRRHRDAGQGPDDRPR